MTQADIVYKSKAEIIAELKAAWQAAMPDAVVTDDSVIGIWNRVFGGTTEGLYLGIQLLHDDMFIQTMSQLALQREGEVYGRQQKAGTLSTGSVTFTGAGGTFIALGSTVAVPVPGSTALIFETVDDVTIPNPGIPIAPTTAAGAAGAISGTVEYAVTFVTASGETEVGAASTPLTVTSKHVSVSAIPVGGPGTSTRNLYRRDNGGAWLLIINIADNSTTTYSDNDNTPGPGSPPDDSTAERVSVSAQSTETGSVYNVVAGAITDLANVDSGVTSVTNAAAFIDGTDPEALEEFRGKLLEWIQAPMSGAPQDLVAWATSIDGIETATVFKNQDLSGSSAPGTAAVRVSGPLGSVPDSGKLAEVLAELESHDLANITILVGAFTADTTNSAVTVTLMDGYDLSDVTPAVKAAIEAYIDGLPVGADVYKAGISHAVFGLPGILTVSVTTPSSDVTIAATHKAVHGTTTVS